MQRTRQFRSTPQLKEGRRIGWYAAIFDQEATVHDFRPGATERSDYREVIRPGAFADALKGDWPISGTIDHDRNQMFAERTAGSLLLQEDAYGLYASAYLPHDDLGDKIIEDIKAGNLDGASFGWESTRTEGEKWTGDSCELLQCKLTDVCITASPAYPQTKGTVHLRSANRLKELLLRLRLAKLKM